MAGAPPPASLPTCCLISDCCASNQRDSVGVGPSEPGAGYTLLGHRFLSPRKSTVFGWVWPDFPGAVCHPWKGNSLTPCASRVRQCLAPASAGARCTHPLTCAQCLALPSEMNRVPQMEMQKSPAFCVAHAGSCRPELFLFGHLGSSPESAEYHRTQRKEREKLTEPINVARRFRYIQFCWLFKEQCFLYPKADGHVGLEGHGWSWKPLSSAN
nr:uncharacterized protein LOC129059994 [Pongo abelii]